MGGRNVNVTKAKPKVNGSWGPVKGVKTGFLAGLMLADIIKRLIGSCGPDNEEEASVAANHFGHSQYQVRKKIITLLGATFHVFDPAGQLLFYSKLKAFKLKEDIRIYTGEDMQTEVLTIKARNILDFSAVYDVVDASAGGQKVGALKRKGMKSIFKDEWLLLDTQDQEIGLITEDNVFLALVRRFILNIIPQHYVISAGGSPVGEFRQNFNPFVMKINVDFTPDTANKIDRRLGLAAAILLCAVEGKQS